jgi:hypothetical protein
MTQCPWYPAYCFAEAEARYWEAQAYHLAALQAYQPQPLEEHAHYGDPAKVELQSFAGGRKSNSRRNRKARERKPGCPPSDGRSLQTREEDALALLKAGGVDGAQLSLEEAVDKHRESTDKDFCRALRVAVASVRVKGQTEEDKRYELGLFYLDVTAYVSSLELEEKEEEKLRSAFLKAAHHRADRSKHLAKGASH